MTLLLKQTLKRMALGVLKALGPTVILLLATFLLTAAMAAPVYFVPHAGVPVWLAAIDWLVILVAIAVGLFFWIGSCVERAERDVRIEKHRYKGE